MNPRFVEISSSTINWNWLFHGEFLDEESGLHNYGYRYYHPELGRWPSRDPIAERGGVNLYGFAGNDGVNRLDFLGLAVPSSHTNSKGTNNAIMKEAHDAGTQALKDARAEFEKLKEEGRRSGKTFDQPGPREYGGKICRRCDPTTGKYTYYSTRTEGDWPNDIKDPKVAGRVDPNSAPDCDNGDKLMALWHTHPGKYNLLDGTYSQGDPFTDPDRDVADGAVVPDEKSGGVRHIPNINNPEGVPLAMTRDDGTGSGGTETFAYQFGEYAHYVE